MEDTKERLDVRIAEMYQDYIDGKVEIREINQRFNARYERGMDQPEREGCGMQ